VCWFLPTLLRWDRDAFKKSVRGIWVVWCFCVHQGCTVLLSHIPEHSGLVPYQSSLSGLLSPTARHAAVFLCASFGMACAASSRMSQSLLVGCVTRTPVYQISFCPKSTASRVSPPHSCHADLSICQCNPAYAMSLFLDSVALFNC